METIVYCDNCCAIIDAMNVSSKHLFAQLLASSP